MMWRKVAVLLIVFGFLASPYCFAEEYVSVDKYEQSEKRVKDLEEKLVEQNKYIQSQNASLQAQQQKIGDYESKLSKFGENLHEVPGTPMKLMEGLELGAGGTMIVQGADNTNNAASDVTKKEGRADASYSADITLGEEFKDVGGKAFLHLESGQGAGLEDNLTLQNGVIPRSRKKIITASV